MKLLLALQAAALSAAFVLPNEQFNGVELEGSRSLQDSLNKLPSKSDLVHDLEESFQAATDEFEHALHHISDEVEQKYDELSESSTHALDDALTYVENTGSELKQDMNEAVFDAKSWAESASESLKEIDLEDTLLPTSGHHKKPNQTVYQLIASSKYTTKLAKLINEYDDLVDLLNGTAANYTVFAPTDYAFEKIPDDAYKPTREQMKKILTYHVSPEFYPAGRVLVTRTIPTALKSNSLGTKPLPQRLSTNVGLRGLTVNFYSRIVAIDIFGTNGVIHGVDSLILPPPRIMQIIDFLPTEFSTLQLGLTKTGLFDKLNTSDHKGGTTFAPSNRAFAKLGTEANAFLFSRYGLKYLEPILRYHVVKEPHTLYSDAYYKGSEQIYTIEDEDKQDVGQSGVPKGQYHVDLPTFLKDRDLSIDIGRYGRLIEMKINGLSRVEVPDGVAQDGVLHGISNVLIPPKQLADGSFEEWDGESEITVEELKERLEPFVDEKEPEWSEEL